MYTMSDVAGIPAPISCVSCCHNRVCAIYDSFMDSQIKSNNYPVMTPNYDNYIYKVLGENCSEFKF